MFKIIDFFKKKKKKNTSGKENLAEKKNDLKKDLKVAAIEIKDEKQNKNSNEKNEKIKKKTNKQLKKVLAALIVLICMTGFGIALATHTGIPNFEWAAKSETSRITSGEYIWSFAKKAAECKKKIVENKQNKFAENATLKDMVLASKIEKIKANETTNY